MADGDDGSVFKFLNFKPDIDMELHQLRPRVRLGKPTIRISDKPPHPFLEKKRKSRQLNVSKGPVEEMDKLEDIVNHFSNLNIQCKEEHIKKVELEREINLEKLKEVQMEEFRELFDLPYAGEDIFDRIEKMTVKELDILFNGDSKFKENPDLPHDGYKKYLDMRIQRESLTDLHDSSQN